MGIQAIGNFPIIRYAVAIGIVWNNHTDGDGARHALVERAKVDRAARHGGDQAVGSNRGYVRIAGRPVDALAWQIGVGGAAVRERDNGVELRRLPLGGKA